MTASSMRAMFPEEVNFRSSRNAKPENSQFCKYVLSVTNEFFISGKNGNIKTAVPDIIPMRNTILRRFLTIISNPGKNISGKNFTSTANANEKPATKEGIIFLRKGCEVSLGGPADLFSAACFNSSKRTSRKKKMPAPSMCPEAAISSTGKGCHA